jgi:hypothetical protein
MANADIISAAQTSWFLIQSLFSRTGYKVEILAPGKSPRCKREQSVNLE